MARISNDVRDVAAFIVSLGKRDSVRVSPKVLQKLLYLANGWSMAENGHHLFSDNFEAWPQGPVVRGVWEMNRGSSAPIQDVDGCDQARISEKDRHLIEQVWFCYKNRTAHELEEITHDSAWARARGHTKDSAPSNATISEPSIRDAFSEMMRRSKDEWDQAISSAF